MKLVIKPPERSVLFGMKIILKKNSSIFLVAQKSNPANLLSTPLSLCVGTVIRVSTRT